MCLCVQLWRVNAPEYLWKQACMAVCVCVDVHVCVCAHQSSKQRKASV